MIIFNSHFSNQTMNTHVHVTDPGLMAMYMIIRSYMTNVIFQTSFCPTFGFFCDYCANETHLTQAHINIG